MASSYEKALGNVLKGKNIENKERKGGSSFKCKHGKMKKDCPNC